MQIAQAPPPPPEMPVCSDDDMGCVVTKMEYFSNQMCACQDWPCAEKVNEGLTQWGQQLAKSGVANKKPDPAHANRATEVMIRYGDCMTKLVHQMTPDPDPCAGSDPCAGD